MAGAATAVGDIGAGNIRTMPACREHPTKHIHHRRQPGPLVPGHRQQRAGNRRRCVGCRVAVTVKRPVRRDRLALFAGQIDLAARDSGMGKIQNEGRFETGRRGPALRVVANQLVRPAMRRHGRAGIRRQKPDHAGLGKLAGEIHRGSEMSGSPDADGGNAKTGGARQGQINSLLDDPLPDAIAPIKRQKRSGVGDDAGVNVGLCRAAGKPRAIPESAHDPMR